MDEHKTISEKRSPNDQDGFRTVNRRGRRRKWQGKRSGRADYVVDEKTGLRGTPTGIERFKHFLSSHDTSQLKQLYGWQHFDLTPQGDFAQIKNVHDTVAFFRLLKCVGTLRILRSIKLTSLLEKCVARHNISDLYRWLGILQTVTRRWSGRMVAALDDHGIEACEKMWIRKMLLETATMDESLADFRDWLVDLFDLPQELFGCLCYNVNSWLNGEQIAQIYLQRVTHGVEYKSSEPSRILIEIYLKLTQEGVDKGLDEVEFARLLFQDWHYALYPPGEPESPENPYVDKNCLHQPSFIEVKQKKEGRPQGVLKSSYITPSVMYEPYTKEKNKKIDSYAAAAATNFVKTVQEEEKKEKDEDDEPPKSFNLNEKTSEFPALPQPSRHPHIQLTPDDEDVNSLQPQDETDYQQPPGIASSAIKEETSEYLKLNEYVNKTTPHHNQITSYDLSQKTYHLKFHHRNFAFQHKPLFDVIDEPGEGTYYKFRKFGESKLRHAGINTIMLKFYQAFASDYEVSDGIVGNYHPGYPGELAFSISTTMTPQEALIKLVDAFDLTELVAEGLLSIAAYSSYDGKNCVALLVLPQLCGLIYQHPQSYSQYTEVISELRRGNCDMPYISIIDSEGDTRIGDFDPDKFKLDSQTGRLYGDMQHLNELFVNLTEVSGCAKMIVGGFQTTYINFMDKDAPSDSFRQDLEKVLLPAQQKLASSRRAVVLFSLVSIDETISEMEQLPEMIQEALQGDQALMRKALMRAYALNHTALAFMKDHRYMIDKLKDIIERSPHQKSIFITE
jgi:hypothetical protein